jgi:hypothetical protein
MARSVYCLEPNSGAPHRRRSKHTCPEDLWCKRKTTLRNSQIPSLYICAGALTPLRSTARAVLLTTGPCCLSQIAVCRSLVHAHVLISALCLEPFAQDPNCCPVSLSIVAMQQLAASPNEHRTPSGSTVPFSAAAQCPGLVCGGISLSTQPSPLYGPSGRMLTYAQRSSTPTSSASSWTATNFAPCHTSAEPSCLP